MVETRVRRTIVVVAWVTFLAVSLYRIVLQEVFRTPVSDRQRSIAAAAIVLAGLLLTFVWKTVRPLRSFYALFLVMVGAEYVVYNHVDRLPIYRRWLGNPSFSIAMPAEKSLGLIVTLIVVAFLLVLKRRREAFYLAKGDLAAPAAPVRWLGVKPGATWRTLGRAFAIYLSVGTLAFLILAGRPRLGSLPGVLPFLPAILIAAALNAFNEEMTYKASFLSVLEDVVGKQQAVWLVAAYFGILHYYGVPYGVVGVLLATFLGWFLGKSMLETRGVFWAWFLHFLQDVWIFIFMVIGSITPGGQ